MNLFTDERPPTLHQWPSVFAATKDDALTTHRALTVLAGQLQA